MLDAGFGVSQSYVLIIAVPYTWLDISIARYSASFHFVVFVLHETPVILNVSAVLSSRSIN